MFNFDRIRKNIIDGNVSDTLDSIEAALNENTPAVDILNKGLLPGIEKVGNLFENGDIYFPELLMAGKAMKEAAGQLKAELSKRQVSSVGKFAIGTVQDDLHDIGKNIVCMFFEANGWDVTDLGINVSPERFCEAVKNGDFDILALSSLLTITMPNLGTTINALEEAGLRDKTIIMVGGVSVTQEYANEIGADGYGKDAIDAVRQANKLLYKV